MLYILLELPARRRAIFCWCIYLPYGIITAKRLLYMIQVLFLAPLGQPKKMTHYAIRCLWHNNRKAAIIHDSSPFSRPFGATEKR